jgi:hypothetical protein
MGAVAYVCNPGTWEAEIRRIAVWRQCGQRVQETSFQSVAGCGDAHLLSHLGREAQIWGQPRHKARPYPKNNHCKKGWRHDSSGGVPA